jgi:AAA family ATP:ADP antiporter
MVDRSTNLAIEVDGSSTLRRWISGFVPVKRSEIVTVVILTVNVFVLLSCYYVLKVLREPLILLGGGAELKAYASAGQALLLLAVVPAFSWLSSRVDRARLLTTMQLIFIGCLIAFYALAQARAPIGLAFYLWLGIFNILLTSNFWSFANDLYTEEQGKRLFAVIGVGASVGAIVGAFVPHLLHRTIGTYALLLVAAAGLGLSIVLYRLADIRERGHAHHVPVPGSAVREAPMSKKGGFTLVIKDRYLRLLAAMLLVATVINTTGEYVIGKMATERSKAYAADATPAAPAAPRLPASPDPSAAATRSTTAVGAPTPPPGTAPGPAATPTAAHATGGSKPRGERAAVDSPQGNYLSDFYADYYGLVNLLSFLLQALLVARLLTHLGLRRSLFIMPLVALGGWFALGLFVNLTMVRIEKTAENSLDYSLHNTLRHALFLPTSRDSKYKAQAAIDTFFFRMGDVIAGLGIVFLFVEVLGLGIRAFAVLNVALALCWLALAARAGRLHDRLIAAQGGRAELTPAEAGRRDHGKR